MSARRQGVFDFLGYTFDLLYRRQNGKTYQGYRPSKKSIRRMVKKIHALKTALVIQIKASGFAPELAWSGYVNILQDISVDLRRANEII